VTIRVLHIFPYFGSGGAEHMGVYLMRSLNRARFEVEAVSLYDPWGTDLEKMLAEAGVTVSYLGKKRGPDFRMYPRLARVFRRFRPHVVHTHLNILRYVLPLLVHRISLPSVHTVHNLAEREVDFGKWIHRLAFRLGVVPVAIGDEVAASLARLYGIRNPPLIPYGIPIHAFVRNESAREVWREKEGFALDDTVYVSVARFYPQKNHRLLLHAFADGPARDMRARLLLAGDGPLRGDLQVMANRLGVGNRVSFLGIRTDIPELVAAADVFALSSDWEGNPLSVMEAMAAGRPVVATAVGGVPELVVHGKTGLLVPAGDAVALAEAMRKIGHDEALRKEMGRASAERAASCFDERVMTRSYEELYERLLGNGAGPS
jgi:glycosyltransferase involved in cell wall biosynthesis